MGWLALLLAMLPLGYLAGRRWIVAAVPVLIVALLVVPSIVENTRSPCERPDGCGAGPVMNMALWALIVAGLAAALLALGVRLRHRGGNERHGRGHPAR